MAIPYEELSYEPNRSPAERLGAIVGRRFVFSREQWPAWDRLVSRYTWPVVIKAADRCDPAQRFSNHVEAMCVVVAKAAAESRQPQAIPTPTTTPAERKELGDLFRSIRSKHGV